MEEIKQIIAFSKRISEQVETEFSGEKLINAYVEKFDKPNADYTALLENYKSLNINIEKEDYYLLFISAYSMKWDRAEKKSGEGFLSGGFRFNNIKNVYSSDVSFWKESLNDLLKYESEERINLQLLEQLCWIESPSHPEQSVDAEYTPYFGCVTLSDDKSISQFYFYDSGLVYKLPFTAYKEYIHALKDSAAVKCWQYFYIDPIEIIKKNKDLAYITWGLYKNSRLTENISDFQFHEEIPFDRLDLIAEYLERCVRLLPETFPFLTDADSNAFNFEHHIHYYERFKALYEASRINI